MVRGTDAILPTRWQDSHFGQGYDDQPSQLCHDIGVFFRSEARQLMDRDLIAKSDPYCVIKCGPGRGWILPLVL